MNGAGRWFRKPCLLCVLPPAEIVVNGTIIELYGSDLVSLEQRHAPDCIFWTPPEPKELPFYPLFDRSSKATT